MDEDPKALAAEILGEIRAEKTAKEPADSPVDDDDEATASPVEAMKDAFRLMQAGKFAEALPALRLALASDED